MESVQQDNMIFFTKQIYQQLQKDYPEYGIADEEIEAVSHLAPIQDVYKRQSGSYTDKNTTYLSKDGYVTYQVKEDGPYDSVAIKINGEYSDTVTGTENSGSLTGTFYLYNSKDPKTRTDADSKEEGEQDNVIPKDVLVVLSLIHI